MQFNALKEQVKSIGFDELRTERDNYFEAVIVKSKLRNLIKTLKNFFGGSVWPSRNRLSLEIEGAIKDYGGIMDGQTLYFYNQDHNTIFAMLWPWQDGEHTTVKIVQR